MPRARNVSASLVTVWRCDRAVPPTYSVQMFGWFSADAARASRRNCSSAWESLAKASGRNVSDVPAEGDVLSLIYHVHAPADEFCDYAVVRVLPINDSESAMCTSS
jgi:hypothetical protein